MKSSELPMSFMVSAVSGWQTSLGVLASLPLAAAGCGTSSAGAGDAAVPVAMCAHPGGAVAGPADDHCATAGPDGGPLVQAVTLACSDPGPQSDGGEGPLVCPYGTTKFGSEADDDDCKYHMAWTSTPICELPGAAYITLVVTSKADGKPVTGARPYAEIFPTSPADCGAGTPPSCDDCATHAGPNNGVRMTEGPAGTYVAPLEFDESGAWTVRFHFFAMCAADLPEAPHGHVAFHIQVP